MCRIHSRHFQICGIDKYWQIPYVYVSSRHYSSIYARTPENVDEYSVFAYSRLFFENKRMWGSAFRLANRASRLKKSLTNTRAFTYGCKIYAPSCIMFILSMSLVGHEMKIFSWENWNCKKNCSVSETELRPLFPHYHTSGLFWKFLDYSSISGPVRTKKWDFGLW